MAVLSLEQQGNGLGIQTEPEPAGVYSEFSERGEPREHQRLLWEFLRSLSPREARHLTRQVRRRIAEEEVTFNILGDPEGKNRPWQVDPFPLVIARDTWDGLAAGLQQRARLLDAIFNDLYGPQRLLRERVLPPAVVLGNPNYFRGCVGWQPRGGHRLCLQGFDVGRDSMGRFAVYSDRTASPTGFGYALQNRLAVSGVLGSLFEQYRVERLKGFAAAIRQCVRLLNPRPDEDGRVVVLSAGMADESAFEHAYLTRYLGYDLVEGRDLTVRNRVVYLKTLTGLERVDVVIRRIHDQNTDPLSLREDAAGGVAGLALAAEAGNVALLNPLGSAIAESPALKAYLGPACRFLLGEELRLPSVSTHWCGDPDSLRFALRHADELVFKPAFGDRQGAVLRPTLMTAEQKEQLFERVRSSPALFVAESWPTLSVAPVLDASGAALSHQSVALRAFLCREGEDFALMPGGLARMDSAPDGVFLSVAEERLSKDVWVLAAADTGDLGAVASVPNERVELRRGANLPSRLLDDTYWLGRYLERSEATARLLRCALDRVSSEAQADAVPALAAVWAALQAMEVFQSAMGSSHADITQNLLKAVSGLWHVGTLRGQLRTVHGLATRTRSRLSRDVWHVLHHLTNLLEAEPCHSVEAAIERLDELLRYFSAMRGSTSDNVVRSHAWTFLDMGCRVERGVQTLSLLRSVLQPGAARVHMEVLLELADSLLTYRSRYLSRLQVAPVVDLLLTDDTNPRAVAFQASELVRHVQSLPRPPGVVRGRAERRLIALQSVLLTVDVHQACAGDGSVLRAVLEDASDLLWQFSDDLSRTWFSHTPQLRAMSSPSWINEELEAQ